RDNLERLLIKQQPLRNNYYTIFWLHFGNTFFWFNFLQKNKQKRRNCEFCSRAVFAIKNSIDTDNDGKNRAVIILREADLFMCPQVTFHQQ
ncbi:MAG: hypothetical protein FWG61_04315, partial [Firmicutes bacterium]|nr:hypothetical protein [Bacillota bacterium]